MSWTAHNEISDPGAPRRDTELLQGAVDALMADAFAFGVRFINDAKVRRVYMDSAREAAQDLMWRAKTGQMSYAAAATEANEIRNALMEIARSRTSEVTLAHVRRMKAEGLTLDALITRHAKELFNKTPQALTVAEREAVMRRILEGAARTSPKATAQARRLGRLGRGLFWLSLGLAVHDIWQAEDRPRQAAKEGAVLGAGLLGSVAGGAAAGLVCGPGAPVCSGIGVVVGGALFAFGISLAID